MLIVDGLSDRYAGTDRNQTWPDTDYAFGAIWNFGGHTTIGANTGVWEDRFWRWRTETGSRLSGIAVMPEASDNNPAAFDYLTGLAWRDSAVDRDGWFTDWATRRYGASDAAAAKAWRAIGATAYNLPADGDSEAQDGLFAAEPSLDAASAATWSPTQMQYDATAFAAALPALLSVRAGLRDSPAYKYDLMDVTRQVLSNRSRILLPRLKAAYDGKRRAEFDRLSAEWMRQLDLLDQVTATNKQTMLGPWLADASAAGDERAARTLLTVWGTRAGYNAGLSDYANREWSGLISTYYAPRWKVYLTELSAALKEGRAAKKFDWYQYGADWAASTTALSTTPTGDIHRVASTVLSYLQANPEPLTTTVSVDPRVLPDGGTAQVTVKVRNDDPYLTAKRGTATLSAPAGLTVTPAETPLASLSPGQESSATFTVQATGAGTGFFADLTATVKASTGTAVASARVLRSGGVQSPNLTTTTNSAVFGQQGDQYLIEGAGNDLWGGTNQFGAIYRDDLLSAGATITTRVLTQDRTGPWARAGLITSTDLAGSTGRGYANIAVAPDNGCVFSYDSNSDGNLDRFAQLPGIAAPAWVRLSRSGDTITGSCSTDGTTWQPVGSAAVPAGASLDAGLFMSAANGGNGARGAVQFDGFTAADRSAG